MALSPRAFRALPLEHQLMLVQVKGVFLAKRWADGQVVGLYVLPNDLLCEVYINLTLLRPVRTRLLVTYADLDAYLSDPELDALIASIL